MRRSPAQPFARLVVAIGDAGARQRSRTGTACPGSSTDRPTSFTRTSSVHASRPPAGSRGSPSRCVQVGDRLLAAAPRGESPPTRSSPRSPGSPSQAVIDQARRGRKPFCQRTDRLGLGEEEGPSRCHRVGGAVHPGVVVITVHDPLVGQLAAGQHRDDVVHRLEAQRTAVSGRPGQGPAPAWWRAAEPRATRRRHRAGESREQRLGVGGRDRQHRFQEDVRFRGSGRRTAFVALTPG